MILSESHQKVTADHLSRDAYLYVRQSTIRQVFENTESTTRQYALRDRAVALGWPIERVHVIDTDLGKSGAYRRSGGLSAPGDGSRPRSRGHRARAGSLSFRPQLHRLAPALRDVRARPTRSSSMKTASTIRRILTTDFYSD